MQIQKGLVKYKDRSDIVCTYGLTEEGRQYYFLDNTSMSNGNIIASTVLVEAIDPVVVASSVGVIDANGEVVIPFENRSIKPVMDGLVLVEIANSTTPSVVEANSLKSDPLAATKLVTTPATIKDKINAKMGAEGRFIFNDQFSEATICDYSGNNILDNQYFSFIAIKNNETLYLSKNTVDSPVLEYSIPNRMFVAQSEIPLDVQNTDVTQETIDVAMNASEQQVTVGFNADDITEKDFESVMDGAPVEEPLPVDPSVVDPNAVPTVPVENTEVPAEVPAEETEESSDDEEEPESVIPAEIPQEEVAPDVESAIAAAEANADLPVEPSTVLPDEEVQETVSEEVPAEEVNETVVEETPTEEVPVEDAPVEEVQQEEVPVEEEQAVEVPVEEPVEEPASEEVVVEDNKLMEFDFADENTELDFGNDFESNDIGLPEEDVVSDFKSDLFTDDLDSDIFADSTLQADKIDISDSYNDFGYKMPGAKDSIIEDVASTMSNLIRQNKHQKQIIASYEDKMDQAAAAYKKVVDKARGQLRDVEVLKNKIKNYETIVTKLEAKLEVLENKVRDQDKVIASQSRELESLRPQVEGKEELVKILADAQSLLDN